MADTDHYDEHQARRWEIFTQILEEKRLQHLREHELQAQINHQDHERLAERLQAEVTRIEQLTATREAAETEARRLHSSQVEARLTALNGEQDRLAADRERFLPRELFEAFSKELDSREQAWQKEAISWRETQVKVISDLRESINASQVALRESTATNIATLRETFTAAQASTAGRDRGIGLSWSILLAIIAVMMSVITVLERLFFR